VGEFFSSVKQLLGRYSMLPFASAQNGNFTTWMIYPWASGSAYLAAGTFPAVCPLIGGDTYSNIANMYCFYKGSVKLHVQTAQTNGGNTTGPQQGIYSFLYNLYSTTQATSVFNSITPSAAGNWVTTARPTWVRGSGVTFKEQGYAQVKVPYYNANKCSMVLNNTTSDNIITEASSPPITAGFYTIQGFNSTNIALRSFGDDFQLSYFVGCPPLLISYT